VRSLERGFGLLRWEVPFGSHGGGVNEGRQAGGVHLRQSRMASPQCSIVGKRLRRGDVAVEREGGRRDSFISPKWSTSRCTRTGW
jgi:hypothetical protein